MAGVYCMESLICWQVEQPATKKLIVECISGHQTRYPKVCYNLRTPKWPLIAVQCNSSMCNYLNPDPLGGTNYFALPSRWQTSKSTPNLDSIKKWISSDLAKNHEICHLMVGRVKLLGAQMVQRAWFHNKNGTMSLQNQNNMQQQVSQISLIVTIIRPMW